jgi:uncharacterized membrane protein YeaQ/YmgE (transglycosylase-associated protein family)
MSILLFIIFGAIVGWVASIIMGNIVVGIVGAFLGSWIMSAINGTGISGFNLSSFLVALLGAVILLFIVNLFHRRGSRAHS